MDSKTERKIRLIGGGVGKVLEVDYDGIGWDKFARLKYLIDVTNPLKRIQQIRNSNGSVVMDRNRIRTAAEFLLRVWFAGAHRKGLLEYPGG